MKNLFRLKIPSNRVFGLDLMRAMAILFVMISHAELQLPESLKAVNRLFYFDGVLIFFVLSGFLIGSIFIKQLEENQQGGNVLLKFWKRRWLRTLPAYLFTLILLIVLSRHSNPAFPLNKVWKYFLFVQNINDARGLFFSGNPGVCQ
jgi:peptidoglycan/LPS O-acetylase OafA/YrhL